MKSSEYTPSIKIDVTMQLTITTKIAGVNQESHEYLLKASCFFMISIKFFPIVHLRHVHLDSKVFCKDYSRNLRQVLLVVFCILCIGTFFLSS